jgi:hypothetical protein
MLCAAKRRKLGLKLRHFRTVDELAMREHPSDRIIDRFAEPPALRADIDERHGIWTKMLVHGALQGLGTGH